MTVEVINDDKFQDIIKGNDRVVVKFFADWCGSCRLFAPKFERMSNNEDFQGIKFVKINAEENPGARKFAGVTNLPFFATIKNGELVTGDCLAKEDKVAEMINAIK